MLSQSRSNCGECKRRKIKCTRELPCRNCNKYNTYCYYIKVMNKSDNYTSNTIWQSVTQHNDQSHLITIKGKDRDEGHGLIPSEYKISLKLEKRLEGLNFMLSRLVNQSMIDPKIESIMEGFDFKLYENTFGTKICKKVVKPRSRQRLYHPDVDRKTNDLMSDLVEMSFEYSTLCTVSFTTIQECYAKSGINSYLVNCIASSMLPHYMMLKGRLKRLELPDNVFYLRALHLLNSPNTSHMEIICGTPYIILLEFQFGNILSAFVHLGKLTATCFQLGLHCLDEQHSMSPRTDNDLKTCEMRNGWWACLNIESVSSICFLKPNNLMPNPMKTQMPHPNFDFNPSPFDFAKSISNSFSPVTQALYHKESHFNSLAKMTWLAGCVGINLNMYLKFRTNYIEFYHSFQALKLEYRQIFEKTEHHFNLDRFLENIQSNPVYYATTSQLTLHIAFHCHVIIHWFIQNNIDTNFNQLGQAKNSSDQTKTYTKMLLKFIRSTIALPDYPPPTLDLTDYYLSGQIIPFVLLQIMKVFVPVQSQHDLESLALITAVIRKYSFLSSAWEQYFEWCQIIIKHNGRFDNNSNLKLDNLVIGLLRVNW